MAIKRYKTRGGYRAGGRQLFSAGVLAARDAWNRYRSYGSRTMTQYKKRVGSGKGITTQHDRKLIYKKSSMPKGKKRRWKKFKNKVFAVSEKSLGTRSVLFNRQVTVGNDNSDPQFQQGALTISLYGNQAATELHNNDLQYISQLENNSSAITQANGIGVNESTKFIFKSACLDLTIRNVSTKNNTGVVSIDGNCKVELDIYEITSSRQFYEKSQNSLVNTSYASIEGLINTMLTSSDIVNDENIVGEVKVNANARGFTPFDATYAISRYGLKIWKKTKFFIPAGDTITYQVRDPKRHVLSRRSMSDSLGCNRPGMTRFLFVVSKLVPGNVQGSSVIPGNCQLNLAFGMTRKYVYKVEGANDDRSEYIAQT